MSLLHYDSQWVPEIVTMHNSGVLCYLNSLIQALLCLPTFNKFLVDRETEFSAEVFTDHPGAQAQERGVPPGFWMWADDFDWWVLDNWGAGGEDEDDYAGLSGFGLTLWLYENGLEAKWFFARAVDSNFVRISAMFDDAAELIIQERD